MEYKSAALRSPSESFFKHSVSDFVKSVVVSAYNIAPNRVQYNFFISSGLFFPGKNCILKKFNRKSGRSDK